MWEFVFCWVCVLWLNKVWGIVPLAPSLTLLCYKLSCPTELVFFSLVYLSTLFDSNRIKVNKLILRSFERESGLPATRLWVQQSTQKYLNDKNRIKKKTVKECRRHYITKVMFNKQTKKMFIPIFKLVMYILANPLQWLTTGIEKQSCWLY